MVNFIKGSGFAVLKMPVRNTDREAVRALLTEIKVPEGRIPEVLSGLELKEGLLTDFPGTKHDCVNAAYSPVVTNKSGDKGYVGVVLGDNTWEARFINPESGHYFTLREDGSHGSFMCS
jgi:hypothetical protein